ncbi:MAG: hypothetical protein BGO90_02520 [Legionella sp. 40-6]|nr:hypothetical protein [Legionella sp.]OJY08202.1 MAG: hypothetical protein BGO90_02520 [Legionella sp. 40-6]
MISLIKRISALALTLAAATSFATAPAYLVTHNNTNEESNAFIAGVPSIYPTPAQSTKQVYWNLVKIACYGHTNGKECPAVIKMATNTPQPVVLGTVILNIDTGDINPKTLSGNGYTLIVNGPGEATIVKN